VIIAVSTAKSGSTYSLYRTYLPYRTVLPSLQGCGSIVADLPDPDPGVLNNADPDPDIAADLPDPDLGLLYNADPDPGILSMFNSNFCRVIF
jgi:hypothetical protein